MMQKTILLGITLSMIFLGTASLGYAATDVIDSYEKITMNTVGTSDGTTIGYEAGDLFGYKSTNMGDIDNNGAEDFATIAFTDNNSYGNAYLVLMNTDSTVKESHELSNCSDIAGQKETRTFGESLEYLGVINGKHVLLISDHWFGEIYALNINPADYTHTCSLLEDANGYGAEASNYPYLPTVDGIYDLGWPMTVVGDIAVDGDTSTVPNLIVGIGAKPNDDDDGTRSGADDPNEVYPSVTPLDLIILDLSVNATNHIKVTEQIINDEHFDATWVDRQFENTIIADIDGNASTTNLVLGEPRGDWTGINGYVHVTTILNSISTFTNLHTIEFANLEIAINQTGTPNFGIGLASMGDLNGDGIEDIAVGIEFLDVGNNNSGAVAIMLLNSNGSVKEMFLLSNDTKPYPLATSDLFGKGLEAIDIDGDGFAELVASAHQDDTGGNNAGAVYVLTFDQSKLNAVNYDMTPTPIILNPTFDNYFTEFSSFVNYAYADDPTPAFGLTALPFTSTTTQIDDVTTIQKIDFAATFCQDLTIDELITSGNYTVFDNRDGSLGSTVQGTSGNDLMIASNNGDTLVGKEGDDCIIGGSGDDTLKGKKGNDIIYGNDGNDLIRGNAGDDIIYGNSGNDELHGGNGSDILNGGLGDDILRGKKGSDTLNGGEGNDNLFGGKGNDFLYGNAGDDSLNGRQGTGTDTCDGGIGTNIIKNCEL